MLSSSLYEWGPCHRGLDPKRVSFPLLPVNEKRISRHYFAKFYLVKQEAIRFVVLAIVIGFRACIKEVYSFGGGLSP